MFLHVTRFEARYLLRNPLLWATAAVTAAALVAGMSASGPLLGAEGGLLRNAAYATAQNYLGVSVLFMFVTAAFVAGAVVRDDETGFSPIIRATGVARFDYLMGRFAGAFGTAALCLLAVPVATWLGTQLPWADAAALGPNRLADHLYGYGLVALPNVFVTSAVLFALATLTRSMMGAYLGVVGVVSAHVVVDGAFGDRPQLQTAVALADPFGGRALGDAVRYWTVAERNVGLPDLTGALLYNRLLWIGVGFACLALAYAAYRTAPPAPRRARTRARREAPASTAAPALTPLPAPAYGPAALRALLWVRTRFEVRQVVFSPSFAVLMAWALLTTLLTLITQRDPDGLPTYPTTLSMLPELEEGLGLIPLIVAIYYAGELVWRERDRRVHELTDTTPISNGAYVLSKGLALLLVLTALLLTAVVASVAVQLSLGYTHLQPGLYLRWFVLPQAWDLGLLAALAVFVQAVSPHKAVGWGVMVLVVLGLHLNTSVEHNLLLYGGSPPVPLSDLNGAGPFWVGAWVFRVYWGAAAALLLLGAHLLWRRGTERRLRPRLALARRRLRGPAGWAAGAALLTFAAAGGYAFYNTNVLNTYRSSGDREQRAAAYERRYGRYADLPQPMVTDVRLRVDLYPAERRAVARGRFRLTNLTAAPVADVHVRVLGDDLLLTRVRLAGARTTLDDAAYGYRIFHLDRPMEPGGSRDLVFETRLQPRGFLNGWPSTALVENGTFLNETQLTPRVGAVRAGMLQDPALRRRYGLPPTPRTPRLEDSAATARPVAGRTWARTDVTVSTAADQTPLATGERVSDAVRGGRRTARFVSSAPVQPRFAVLSARYAERHRQHRGVDLAVYYHPAHAWNVDRMLDALAASLDYDRQNFGPYPFRHARIVEFPGYHDFAQAFPGTIPYAETVGFTSAYGAPETIDYVTYLTAHEFAHQYWAHQVVGAEMEGRELLSETLAQYAAQMVMRRLRGGDHLRRYLQFELDRYLDGRGQTADAEPPLVRVDGQDYLAYRKGALAMYLLQERLGEASVNRALRRLLRRYRFRGAPYPRSLDLVAALRTEARTPEDQALVTDLFERVALYSLRTGTPTAARRPDGRWTVTVPVTATKWYVDGQGDETEVPLAEPIEVGLFTAEPGRDAFNSADVVAVERRPIRSGRQALTFVTDQRPAYAGIDPYTTYVDRDTEDNVQLVE